MAQNLQRAVLEEGNQACQGQTPKEDVIQEHSNNTTPEEVPGRALPTTACEPPCATRKPSSQEHLSTKALKTGHARGGGVDLAHGLQHRLPLPPPPSLLSPATLNG